MCGLFGFLNYSNKEVKGLADLTNALAEHSSIRGTDATGISFVSGGMIRIIKETKAAENIGKKVLFYLVLDSIGIAITAAIGKYLCEMRDAVTSPWVSNGIALVINFLCALVCGFMIFFFL